MTVSTAKKIQIGDALVEAGLISQDQLQRALDTQRGSGKLLGEVLVDEGVVSAEALVETLSRRLGVRGCVLRDGLFDPALMKLITADEAQRLKVLPMFRVNNRLTVAMAEPQSLPTVDRLRQMTGCRIKPVLALEANILDFIRRATEGEGEVDVSQFVASLSDLTGSSPDQDHSDDDTVINLDQAQEQGNAVVRLVNLALVTAIRNRASDVHIEPGARGTRVRYRVDGVLRDLMNPPSGMHGAIVSRVKVMGQMDIAEKRLPQEGRIRLFTDGRGVDLRVSSMPMLLGEKIVLRVLDKSNLKVELEHLGFRTQALETFKQFVHQPHGLVLVTGPTGSGKTTTLYSALDQIRSPDRNIITVEDPVEYQLDLVNQVQVQESIGMTFARALRSILRQDPDIIMVGEIRDEETARVAVQAALTGHLVLATLHTNDAPGAVSRLLDMNIESYLLSGAMNGVVAQRLARTVCQGCATTYQPQSHVLADAGVSEAEASSATFRKGTGCQQCHDSGFQGRVGVYEVMEVTPGLRRLIHQAAPSHELRDQIKEQGGLSLRDEGLLLALAGKTTVEEVLRVTHDENIETA